jgi:type I restriction enzyme, S subunit
MADLIEDDDGEEAVVWGSAYPPSINAGIPKLGELPAGWSRLRMKDMLDVIERPVKLVDSKSYQLVTAKRSRGGIVSRGMLRGDEIKVKQQFEVRAGDFILSNRQIAHGGCGIVPPELDGAIVSGEYTVLDPKPVLDLKFLHYLSHSAYFQQICFHSGVGVHVEKLVFRLHDWLNWQIDVPTLAEQLRIVTIFEDIDRDISSTTALIDAITCKKRSIMGKIWRGLSKGNECTLSDVIAISRNQVSANAIASDSDISAVYSYEAYDAHQAPTHPSASELNSSKFLIERPSVLFGKLNPRIPRVWLTDIVDGAKAIASTEFWPCTPEDDITIEYLYAVLSSSWFFKRQEIQPSSTTKSHQRVDRDAFLSVPVPVPPKTVQNKVGQINRDFDSEIKNLKDQCTRLLKLRRGLLHRLLSGELRINARIDEGAMA